MTQTPKIKTPYAGGWLIREDESIDFDRVSVVVDNTTSGDIVLPGGYPIKALTGIYTVVLAAAGDVANGPFVGAVLEPVVVRAGEKRMVAVAARGLNVFNTQQLPLFDYAGAGMTQAGLTTRYQTDLKWVGRTDPSGAQAAPGATSSAVGVATGGELQT